MSPDYNTMKKDELLEELAGRGLSGSKYSATNKPELIEMLQALDLETAETDTLLDEAEEVDESVVSEDLSPEELEKLQVEVAPHIFSDQWSEFVMGQFEEDEMDGDAPTCAGCRRIVQKLIGPIIKCGVAAHTPPQTNNHGTATVVYQVEVFVTNEEHPAFLAPGGTLFYEDIADVNQDNCDFPYSKHASATAATRAEARIYRKMLNLRNVIAAEEVSERANEEDGDINWTPDDPITQDQIAIINMICSRVNLSVIDFMNSGRQKYADISQIPNRTAVRMIKELNNFQQGVKTKPTTVPAYDPNWRNNETN
jgi:hypothetical protein